MSELGERLAQLGRPILQSGLSKLENGDRRVDVDDLVALALALDVSPNRLLLPATAGDDDIDLAPEAEADESTAWAWACGDKATPVDPWRPDQRQHVFDIDRFHRFRRENRPHDPADDITLAEVEDYKEVLADVSDAARRAQKESGLSLTKIAGYVRVMQTMQMFTRSVLAAKEEDDDGER